MPFVKGQSGNPQGLARDARRIIAGEGRGYAARRIQQSIEEQAGRHGHKALKFLVNLIGDKDAPIKERRLAADSVLDRAYGKPVDRLAIAQVSGDGASQVVAELTTDQLIARLTSMGTTPAIDLKQGDSIRIDHPKNISEISENIPATLDNQVE